VSEVSTISVDVYDKLDVVVEGGVDAHPGTASVEIHHGVADAAVLLIITSSVYNDKLTYKVDGGGAVKLNALQCFIGTGAASLIGATPHKVEFGNATGADSPAAIQLILGRAAA